MPLHILPVRSAGAAENMALDFLLLQRYPDAGMPRFRHYEWQRPAFTFGFSQKIEFVRAHVPAGLELCRRPTGGGIVDHRQDWTYSLVLPRGHPLADARATESYRVVHEALAAALAALGLPAEVKRACDPCESGPGICFQRAELHDVENPRTGAKIAGAAQKRNRHGLLFQGSIEKSAVGAADWDAFAARFTAGLAHLLGGGADPVPWPALNENEVEGLIEQYSAPEWLAYR
ncbi:MAG: lipoate--protein ligase family protein [Opitutaceae bacterium]|nr:lipoate--protein ligase family protein [Opitutaceae bacterium]